MLKRQSPRTFTVSQDLCYIFFFSGIPLFPLLNSPRNANRAGNKRTLWTSQREPISIIRTVYWTSIFVPFWKYSEMLGYVSIIWKCQVCFHCVNVLGQMFRPDISLWLYLYKRSKSMSFISLVNVTDHLNAKVFLFLLIYLGVFDMIFCDVAFVFYVKN